MPSDSRRIAAPESSQSPDLYISLSEKEPLLDGDRRFDGRALDEARPIFLQSGVILQAHGSAYIEVGNTKAVCAVYGPRDIGRRDDFQMDGVLKCEFKFTPFSCRRRRGHFPDHQEMEYSQVLSQALRSAVMMNKFPKSQVDVYVTVLQNGGGALVAGIIAASLALTDASVEMYDMVTAFSVRQAGKDLLLHDPTMYEEFDPSVSNAKHCINHGNITVALLPLLNQVSGILTSGVMDCDILSDAVRKCTSGAQAVYPVLQKAVVDSYYKGDILNGAIS